MTAVMTKGKTFVITAIFIAKGATGTNSKADHLSQTDKREARTAVSAQSKPVVIIPSVLELTEYFSAKSQVWIVGRAWISCALVNETPAHICSFELIAAQILFLP